MKERTHTRMSITIPDKLFEWVEKQRSELEWTRSRYITEWLLQCKEIDRSEKR